MEIDKEKRKKIEDSLFKKALGFISCEVVEEYSRTKEEDGEGELVLAKKKVTKKNIPPDVNAVKALITYFETRPENIYEKMTAKELEAERLRLIKILAKNEFDDEDDEEKEEDEDDDSDDDFNNDNDNDGFDNDFGLEDE